MGLLFSPEMQIPMKSFPIPGRRSLPYFLVFAVIGLVLPAWARSSVPVVRLDPVVTAVTRSPADLRTLGSAVDFLSAEDLERRQLRGLSAALGMVAGAPRFSSGAPGAATSVFLRGANSNQTLFLVDGLRLNDPNTDYAVFLGGSCVSACDSLEVAHGPQSTLHGGEAVGGVVSLRARRGTGGPTVRVSSEAGSFGTIQGALAAQGERGPGAWNFAVQGGHTDNARVNNAFDSTNATLRLDRRVGTRAKLGGTLRWFYGAYGSPGNRFTNDPDNEERESNLLATVFATVQLGPDWFAHAILGGQTRRFVAESPRAGAATAITVVENRRGVLDAQAAYTGLAHHRLTAGLTAETNHTRNTGFGDIDRRQTLGAFFLQDEWSPTGDVHFSAGLRNDDFDTFGRASTGRLTAAWLPPPGVFKLRGSIGTAFRSPSFLDLFGRSAFYNGNPGLRPEKAQGWDAGIDWYHANRRGTLGITWFDTVYTDLIASTADFRSVKNIQRARTRGLEVSGKMDLARGWEARLSYTWLEAENLTSGTRLLRRPRHLGAVDIVGDLFTDWTVGGGVEFASGRRDIHAQTFATIDAEDYSVARLHAAWRIHPRLLLRVRWENLLDEAYESVHGYPALGRGIFGGAEWKF